MKQNDFYEVEGCTWFIPVELIEKHERINFLEVKAIGSGLRTFAPKMYQFPKVHEPQKVAIPKFIADWIEEAKEGECSLCTALGLVDGDSRNFDWLFNGDKSNQDTFARAWIDGYEIEQEQLYTVEIPNPALDNLEFVIVLKRIRGRVCLVNTYDYMGRELSDEYKLTESEIKEDFEWAWQWAKEVENDTEV
ncbi:TPA: DUF1642 domain-containing protein [Streptococcus suis]